MKVCLAAYTSRLISTELGTRECPQIFVGYLEGP